MKLKYLGLLCIGLILAILYFFINPSSAFFPKCPIYSTTGIYCPGCGSQRALHDFLHLDLKGVLEHNILFLFGILILIYDITIKILNEYFNKRIRNLLNYKRTPIIILIVIVLFWIVRNITIYPFKLLAPD